MTYSTVVAWLGAHMGLVLLVAAVAAYLWINIRNARTPIERQKDSPIAAILDRLAMATMKGAITHFSAPGARSKSPEEIVREIARDTMAPPPASDVPAPTDASGVRSRPGFAAIGLMKLLAAVFVLVVFPLALVRCTPTLPADMYRGAGTVVAVTASGGREVALLHARECVDKPTRAEAEACLVTWRATWTPIGVAWQGAASRAQSLAHIVRTVDAMLERRFPASDAGVQMPADGGAAQDAASNE